MATTSLIQHRIPFPYNETVPPAPGGDDYSLDLIGELQ
ncbi:hypothetical protein C942_01213 [Photobacterium marinum]|uniref:Uncharacterized protein n=1 Tax=Photobacterium marinum TaxID=1056511 RepID=L8JEP3_9GAMM|nr:hypothetical protein C942_01213 [Photobacterium marinum]